MFGEDFYEVFHYVISSVCIFWSVYPHILFSTKHRQYLPKSPVLYMTNG